MVSLRRSPDEHAAMCSMHVLQLCALWPGRAML